VPHTPPIPFFFILIFTGGVFNESQRNLIHRSNRRRRRKKKEEETRVQLDKKHWYEHVPKLVETSQGGKVTICGINKYKLTELSPKTNQTLQSVIIEREHVCQ